MYNPIEKLLNEHNDKKTPLDGRMVVCRLSRDANKVSAQ